MMMRENTEADELATRALLLGFNRFAPLPVVPLPVVLFGRTPMECQKEYQLFVDIETTAAAERILFEGKGLRHPGDQRRPTAMSWHPSGIIFFESGTTDHKL